MMRQLIIARKDLNMSAGKLAAQVAHASVAFLSALLKNSERTLRTEGEDKYLDFKISLPENVYNDWICGIFTKTVCQARNRNHLMQVTYKAQELGLEKDKDFFLIKDNCKTELEPEEIAEDGVPRTLTCIGFRPLDDDIAHQLSHRYHLYVG